MRRAVVLAAVLAIAMVACGASERPAVIAAGTTLVDSGLMMELADAYETDTGRALRVVGLGSAEALAYLEAGTADVAITHNPELIDSFARANPQSQTVPVFVSDFVLVGPPGSGGGPDIAGAFAAIARDGRTFVSRDDGSGTNAREVAIWDAVGVQPDSEPWYVRTGTGMGSTLQVADQRAALTLAEVGAFLAAVDTISLAPVPLDDSSWLDNPYVATAIDPTGEGDAAAFVEWLTSDRGRSALEAANTALFGRAVYRAP